MSDPDDSTRRLLRALSAREEGGDHTACQAALPAFVEAEMADEDIARLFPAVQAHLDICEECDALHAEMLDALVAEAAGAVAELDRLPPLVLPRPLRLRRWAQNAAGAALDALKKSRADLDGAAQAFFDALGGAEGRLNLQAVPVAFGLGEADTEALPFVMAAYYALAGLTERHTAADLRRLGDSGQLRPLLERIAGEEARRHGLQGPTAQTFVAAFVALALGDLPQLLDLTAASQPPPHSD